MDPVRKPQVTRPQHVAASVQRPPTCVDRRVTTAAARWEDRIHAAKGTGLRNLPCSASPRIRYPMELVAMCFRADYRMQMLALDKRALAWGTSVAAAFSARRPPDPRQPSSPVARRSDVAIGS